MVTHDDAEEALPGADSGQRTLLGSKGIENLLAGEPCTAPPADVSCDERRCESFSSVREEQMTLKRFRSSCRKHAHVLSSASGHTPPCKNSAGLHASDVFHNGTGK